MIIFGFSTTYYKKGMLKKLIKKLLWPPDLWRAFRVSKAKQKLSRSAEDPQLILYDRILKTGFLHYGYFDDPEKAADKISLDDIRQAQIRYAKLITEQIKTDKGTVLDVGCGMGGLIHMLLQKGMKTMGVTPDRAQVNYISQKYPQADILRSKFQRMPLDNYLEYFDTVIHSESLQYMGLKKSIENVLALLKPQGRWIVTDYFRTAEAHEKSGHYWEDFLQMLDIYNLKIVHQLDITENIKPTLAYIYMWGNEIGKPLFDFMAGKLEKKHPGKHYILKDVIDTLEEKIDKNLDTVNPGVFVRDKKYVLLSIERKPNPIA